MPNELYWKGQLAVLIISALLSGAAARLLSKEAALGNASSPSTPTAAPIQSVADRSAADEPAASAADGKLPCSDAAERMFTYWSSRAVDGVPPLVNDINAIGIYDAITKTGHHHSCLALFRYNAKERDIAVDEAEWEHVLSKFKSCGALKPRLKAMPYFFRMVLLQPANALKFTSDFAFFFDIGDAHRPTPSIYPLLMNVPILTSARALDYDNYSLPVPDAYAMDAWVLNDPGYRQTSADRIGFASNMAVVYHHQLPVADWDDMKPTAVLRASCFDTMEVLPDRDRFVHLRAQLCNVSRNVSAWPKDIWEAAARLEHPLLDVGLRCAVGHTCDQCSLCVGHTHLGPKDMRTYRYQIAADGIGGVFDSSVWKIDSGSVVFRLQHTLDDGSIVPGWQLWWYPLLQDGVHWFLTSAAELPGNVLACVQAPDGCRSIGQAAKDLILKHLTYENNERYMFLVLKHVHDMFQRAEDLQRSELVELASRTH